MATLRQLTREMPYQPQPFYRDHNTRSAMKLDLNSLCIKRPKETFFVQVKNPNLLAWGIELDDVLIVEQNEQFLLNDLLVIEKNGSYKFYQFFTESQGEKLLFSLDTQEPNLRIQDWHEVPVAGVITNIVHSVRNRGNGNSARFVA